MKAVSYVLGIVMMGAAAFALASSVAESVVVPFERVSAEIAASRRADR